MAKDIIFNSGATISANGQQGLTPSAPGHSPCFHTGTNGQGGDGGGAGGGPRCAPGREARGSPQRSGAGRGRWLDGIE